MERIRTNITAYCLFAVSILTAVLGAVSFFLAFGTEFDTSIGHFERNSVWSVVLYCAMGAGVICAAAAWILNAKKRAAEDGTVGNRITHTVVYSLCSAAVFASTVADLVLFFMSVSEDPAASGTMHYIIWALGFISGTCLLIDALPGRYDAPQRALAGFAAPLFLASKVLAIYFDSTVAVNSPLKLVMQLSLLSFMLMMTSESGISLGRAQIYPRRMFTLCASLSVGGAVGIGMLVLFISGKALPMGNAFDAAMYLSFAVFAAVKLFSAKDTVFETLEEENKDAAADD